MELAKRTGAALVTTPDAKSLIDESSPYAGGNYSFGATNRTRAIVAGADFVLAVGTSLPRFATDKGGLDGRKVPVLQIIEDSMDQALLPDDVIVASIAEALGGFVSLQSEAHRPPWITSLSWAPECVAHSKGGLMHPSDAVWALYEALPTPARIYCDITSAALHVLRLPLGPTNRLSLQIEKSACMGTALGKAIGGRFKNDTPTLVVVGDWGMLMSLSELHTLACSPMPGFLVACLSNFGGAMIRSGVREQRIDVPSSVHSWESPRFAIVAKGLGVHALTVRTPRDLYRAARAGLRAQYPVFIDMIVDPDAEIPGAGERFDDLSRCS